MSEIDNAKRKELMMYLKEQYKTVKTQLEDTIDAKAMIGLSGLFSVIFKIVKKGSKMDYEFILNLLKQIKEILIKESIPVEIILQEFLTI